MTNPLNHVRWQRPLALLFLALVLAGIVAGAARALRSAPPPHQVPVRVPAHTRAAPR